MVSSLLLYARTFCNCTDCIDIGRKKQKPNEEAGDHHRPSPPPPSTVQPPQQSQPLHDERATTSQAAASELETLRRKHIHPVNSRVIDFFLAGQVRELTEAHTASKEATASLENTNKVLEGNVTVDPRGPQLINSSQPSLQGFNLHMPLNPLVQVLKRRSAFLALQAQNGASRKKWV